LAAAGVKCLRLPPRSPNRNAFAERWVRSVKRSAYPIGSCSGNLRCGKHSLSSQSIIAKNATIQARTTCCSSLPLLRLSPVGDVASAVENVSAAYSGTTAAPHEYFDHTPTRDHNGLYQRTASTASTTFCTHSSKPRSPFIQGFHCFSKICG